MLARSHLHEQYYYEAVKILEPLIEKNKKDQEVRVLMEEAVTGRDLQVLQLISHGDRLYREEHIEDALAIWRQAASLDPDNSGIKRRIERANRVIERLQQIRIKSETGT